MIRLRPMTMEDADKMLEWKNYAETRQYAIASHDEIIREHHLYWLERNLQYFQIIFNKFGICGAVRIQDGEVSIWIDRLFRGQGIATSVIQRVSQVGYIAKIVWGNHTSMNCFFKAGYYPIAYFDGYFTFQKS